MRGSGLAMGMPPQEGEKARRLPSQNVDSHEARCQHVSSSVTWGHFWVLLFPSPAILCNADRQGFHCASPRKPRVGAQVSGRSDEPTHTVDLWWFRDLPLCISLDPPNLPGHATHMR